MGKISEEVEKDLINEHLRKEGYIGEWISEEAFNQRTKDMLEKVKNGKKINWD